MTESRHLLPAAAVTVSVTLLGASFVATRFVIDQVEPASLAFLRYLVASLCLLPFLAAAGRVRLSRRHVLAFVGLGVLQFGIFQYLLNAGLQHIAASRGAVIFALIPMLTMGVAAAMRFEALTPGKAVASVLSVVGVGLALGDKAFAEGAVAADWTGELLFFAGVCCGATYNAFASRMLRTYPALPFTMLTMLPGLCLLTVLAGAEGLFAAAPAFTPGGWLAIAFLGLPAGAMGFYLFNWALARMSPTRTAIFVPISPLAAALLGALLLDETVAPLFFVGLACVVAAIWLAGRGAAEDGLE